MARAACAQNGCSRPLMGLQKGARLPRPASRARCKQRNERIAYVRLMAKGYRCDLACEGNSSICRHDRNPGREFDLWLAQRRLERVRIAGRQRGERQPTGHATPLGAGAASRGHLREKVAPLHRPAAVSGTAGWPSRYSATGTPAARPH